MDSADGRHVPPNFITEIIDADLASGKHTGIVTRFPPEPNGFLHIGHAKSICLNFGLSLDYGGRCNLRFDDTNPEKEDTSYVEAIEADVRWLGFEPAAVLFASDYFELFYGYAIDLVNKGLAYVDSSSVDEIRERRGTVYEPGTPSPYRERSVEENLDLLARMKAGEFDEGSHVLRAKIDMASKNMLMRDPLIYRIRKAEHHRTGSDWCIYPMYDFAHCLEDAIEHVTHSLCTLEFDNNRELYDWVIDHVAAPSRPEQTEFARLNLAYTVMSKRTLLTLVEDGTVDGWDDPRMPTIAGMRRRGVTPEAIREFCRMIGVAKTNNLVDYAKFEFCLRDDLNARAPRVMAVLDPLKVVLTDLPEGHVETIDAPLWPEDLPGDETRALPLEREIYIERGDYADDPPDGWRRLAPGREVRLRHAFVIRCDEVVRDEAGEVVELRCSRATEGRRVKGTVHWVPASASVPLEVRLYEHLFTCENPAVDAGDRPLTDFVNPASRRIVTARAEPFLADAEPGRHWQLERTGFFYVDPDAPTTVLHRVVTLRDSYTKPAAQPRREREEKIISTAKGTVPRSEEREAFRAAHPEFAAAFARYVDDLDVARTDADVITGDAELVAFFDAAVGAGAGAPSAAKWIVNELLARTKERPLAELPFDAGAFGRLVARVDEERVTASSAKDVLDELVERGGDPDAIIAERGLEVVRDTGVIEGILDDVVAAHPDEFARLKGGEEKLVGFFIGQAMRAAKGAADAGDLRTALLARL